MNRIFAKKPTDDKNKKKRIIKRVIKGKEGLMTTYAFRLFGKSWIVAKSETKWHAGERFKRAPIWTSTIGGAITALFIWKIAIGYDARTEADKAATAAATLKESESRSEHEPIDYID